MRLADGGGFIKLKRPIINTAQGSLCGILTNLIRFLDKMQTFYQGGIAESGAARFANPSHTIPVGTVKKVTVLVLTANIL